MWLDMGLYEPRSVSNQPKKQSEIIANSPPPPSRVLVAARIELSPKSRVKEEKQEDYGLRRP